MDSLVNLMTIGMPATFQPFTFLCLVIGVIGGIIFGSIPGLTATMGITLILPFTFFMNPIDGLTMLTGIYIGGISGGLISASLLNMPGTPAAVATCFDAYPMAQKGKAGQALGLGIISSAIGGIGSGFALATVAPFIAWQALKLGPFEYFSLGIFTYLAISGLLGGNVWKNLVSVAIGIILACIGVDPITCVPRLTFGIPQLKGGIALLPFLLGLFCISQIIEDVTHQEMEVIVPPEAREVKIRELFPKLAIFKNNLVNYIRSFLIGLFTGILPGIGGATSNIISYGVAKSASKYPEKFGTGIPEGIIASETANNGSVGGAMIPLMALGIPGDAATAVLLGAFMIHGIQPGPLLFQAHPRLVYAIFSAKIIGDFVMIAIGMLLIKFFIHILSFPKRFLLPFITISCVLGAFASNNRVFDVWVLILVGIFGYLWKKMGFPLVPILIAYVLEPIVETGLRQGLTISGGSFSPIFTRPISCALLLGGILAVMFGIFFQKKRAVKYRKYNI